MRSALPKFKECYFLPRIYHSLFPFTLCIMTTPDYTHCMRILIATTQLDDIAESPPHILSTVYENITDRLIYQTMPDGSTVEILWSKVFLPIECATIGDLWTKFDLADDILHKATKLAIEEIAATVIPELSSWQVVFHISKPLINSISN